MHEERADLRLSRSVPLRGRFLRPLRHLAAGTVAVVFVCLSFIPEGLAAQLPSLNAAAAFETANRLYEQGRYSDAIAAYQQLLREGQVSAPLLFNLGNAYFKAGQTGRAILSYRLAEQVAPRDQDIQANLQFAREQVNGPTQGLARFFSVLSLDELTILFTVAYWTWLLSLAISILRATSYRRLVRISGVIAVASGIWLIAAWTYRPSERLAVVIASEAVVRYGPLEESQSYYTVPNGAELAVLDHKDRWLKVQDHRGRVGWVQSAEAALPASEALLNQTSS